MIESITQFFLQSRLPGALVVLALGLLATLNPCQLAIHFSALSFLSGRSEGYEAKLRSVMRYAAGRFVCYVVMGVALTAVVRLAGGQALIDRILRSKVAAWVEWILPWLLLLLGVLFLLRLFRHHHSHESCHGSRVVIRRDGHLGSFVLGILLALAFCPESAFMYFGMMIPTSVGSAWWWLLPVLYALSAAAPIAFAGWVMLRSSRSVENWMSGSHWVYRLSNALLALLMFGFAWLIWNE